MKLAEEVSIGFVVFGFETLTVRMLVVTEDVAS